MKPDHLTEEEKAKYAAFLFEQYKRLVTLGADEKPVGFPPLHHYTTGDSLIKIIQSGELWATQVSCLNDSKEVTHAVELLENTITKRAKITSDKNFGKLLSLMQSQLKCTEVSTFGCFIVSFSSNEDDLSQWRAYGGSNGGYSLRFNSESMLQYLAMQGDYLAPVTYSEAIKSKLMEEIVTSLEGFLTEGLSDRASSSSEEWIIEFTQHILAQLSYLAPLMKHRSFERENEWRLIHYLKTEDSSRMTFSERGGMLRRHIPIKLSPQLHDGYTRLPLSGIMVGPQTHKEISKISVGDLLGSRGYIDTQVPVLLSDVPYRT